MNTYNHATCLKCNVELEIDEMIDTDDWPNDFESTFIGYFTGYCPRCGASYRWEIEYKPIRIKDLEPDEEDEED